MQKFLISFIVIFPPGYLFLAGKDSGKDESLPIDENHRN
jgi:hypothetical protein